MKVLLISNLYPPRVRGGYEILCAQFAAHLAATGAEVHVLTSTHDVDRAADETVGPVRVHRHLGLERPFGTPCDGNRWNRRRVSKLNEGITSSVIDELKPDAIMIWSRLRLTAGPSRAAEDSGTPVLYTFNDRHPLGLRPRAASSHLPFRRRIMRRIGAALDATLLRAATDGDHRYRECIVISSALARDLREGGLPLDEGAVLRQGIPLERFPVRPDLGNLDVPLRLLVAGQLHPDKGIDTAIEATHRLARQGVEARLTVAGGGDTVYEEQLKRLAMEGPGPIEFVGRVAHEDMPGLYRSQDVVLFPSRWAEPMGLVHLEAMASGTPVVSTTTGGSAEVVHHGWNALSFRAGSVEELVSRIEQLRLTPQLAHDLATRARSFVEAEHDLAVWCDRIVGRLTELVRLHRTAA